MFHHGFSGSSWFRLGFRCLSPFFSLLSFLRKGALFHHDLLVRLGSGWGSGACLPSSLFFLFSGKGVLFHHGFSGSSWFRLGFRCLSPFFSLLSFLRKGALFHHDLLVRLGSGWVPVLVSLLLSSFFSQEKVFCFIMDFLVPLGSGWGSGACLPSSLSFLSSGKGLCSIMICWFVLVPAGFRCLSPFFSLLSFLRKRCFVSSWIFWFLLVPAGVLVLVSLLLSPFFPQERGSVPS